MKECDWCEEEIIGEGIRFSNKRPKEEFIFVCSEVCRKQYLEWQEEFKKEFKEKIVDNKELIKKMASIVSTYSKMPTGSKVMRESLAAEFAELWKKEMGA